MYIISLLDYLSLLTLKTCCDCLISECQLPECGRKMSTRLHPSVVLSILVIWSFKFIDNIIPLNPGSGALEMLHYFAFSLDGHTKFS